jgi:hypothetical protein
MNGAGEAWPSKQTIKDGAGLSLRGVDYAVDRLEAAGLMTVQRSKGRRRWHYFATTPNDARDAPLTTQGVRHSEEANDANDDIQRRTGEQPMTHGTTSNDAPGAPEVVKEEKRQVRVEASKAPPTEKETLEQRQARVRLLRLSSSLLKNVEDPPEPNELRGLNFIPFDECEGCGRFAELVDLRERLCPSCAGVPA